MIQLSSSMISAGMIVMALMLLLTTTVAAASSSSTSFTGSFATDYIPCSHSCDGGDVNYSLTASVRRMPMTIGDRTYDYLGRTYSNSTSPTFMGPTLKVKPGQSLHIKLINNLTTPIGPNPPTATDYWKMLQNPGEHIKYQRYKRRVSDPSLLKVDHANMPQNFDNTNLHLHGLDVEVHMFDPVNTHNPDAPHVALKPGECYCYKFNVPEHHPTGMYWYHPHLHGSTAVQMWGGMIGLLYVEGTVEEELPKYNIKNTHEFVIWDPAFKEVSNTPDGHNLEVDEFLLGQTTLSKIHPFMVNGKINPTFTTTVGEVLHFRTLCATIENENTFIIYPEGMEDMHWEDNITIPFYIIGSDGVMHKKPKKKNIIVLSGGQREEILMIFDKPGRYVVSQQGIEGMQFFDMRGHPHDQILATIVVNEKDDENDNSLAPTVPIDEMEFTPGYDDSESIQPSDIAGSETIIFSMGANFDQVPFPQYYVNGRPFNPSEIRFHAQPGEAREYTLINANHNAHPFHIHVNRFQVKEMGSELSKETYPVLKSVLDFDDGVWRDTVMVPPNGRTKIWVQFKNYTGKTVVHCHFLAHEDTGMMATLFIGKQDWVFRLEEHIQWIVGIVIGVVWSGVIMYFHASRKRKNEFSFDGRKDDASSYTPVSMNELKAKVID